ncbi:MAG: hypothetical protein MJB12_17175 [Firmicutes bacterium]|nr:hypothetical protein [Bacillota bacterium]
MGKKSRKKSLAQKMADVNVLGDGNLLNVKPSDVLMESFKDYDEKEKTYEGEKNNT